MIRAAVHVFPAGLLRRHVGRAAHQHAGVSHSLEVARSDLADPEVEQLRLDPTGVHPRQEYVGGLQVTMHDALVVRRRQRVNHGQEGLYCADLADAAATMEPSRGPRRGAAPWR